MNPRIQEVKPNTDYTLTLTFQNGEVRVFDVKPYLQTGIFQELQDKNLFYAVTPCLGSVQWKNGQDFCPDTLYLESIPVVPSLIKQETDTTIPHSFEPIIR